MNNCFEQKQEFGVFKKKSTLPFILIFCRDLV